MIVVVQVALNHPHGRRGRVLGRERDVVRPDRDMTGADDCHAWRGGPLRLPGTQER